MKLVALSSLTSRMGRYACSRRGFSLRELKMCSTRQAAVIDDAPQAGHG